MLVSQSKLARLTPNLGILWISVCSFWLCGSIVANPIIYRLVPSPSRYEIRQWQLCFLHARLPSLHVAWSRDRWSAGWYDCSARNPPCLPPCVFFRNLSVWTKFEVIMQAGQKLGIVYIGKAGGKVSVELFWSCKTYLWSAAIIFRDGRWVENCWCSLIYKAKLNLSLCYVKTNFNLQASFSFICKP